MSGSAIEKGVRIVRKAEWDGSDGSKPDVSFMPMMERRRLTLLEKAALCVARKIFAEGGDGCEIPTPGDVPVVFASRWGEIGVTYKLMRQMFDEGEMSPAGFSSSVHNAAPGIWSIFTGNKNSYTSISARMRSREMGLLEAKAQLEAGAPYVLLVHAEESTPEAYRSTLGEAVNAHATAMLLARDGTEE